MKKRAANYLIHFIFLTLVGIAQSDLIASESQSGIDGPSFTSGCAENVPVIAGDPASIDFDATPGTITPIWFIITGVNPFPAGTIGIDSASGVLTFNTANADGGGFFEFTVCVTDGVDTSCCNAYFSMIGIERYEVQIDKPNNSLAGGHETVCVSLNKGAEQIWGYNFLIQYGPAALGFVDADPAEAYNDCEWEYFNYRFGSQGDSAENDLSGLIRIVAIADLGNGAHLPICFLPSSTPAELFCLSFHITRDPFYQCGFIPIRFYWNECYDNVITYNPSSDPSGMVQKSGISRHIFEFGSSSNIADPDVSYPTILGAQNIDCPLSDLNSLDTIPFRFVNYKNGGIELACVDSIDGGRGDIDLNGFCCEVVDVVLFSDYFVYGLGVFTINPSGQIAATDVNADGVPLTIVDFMRLIRIVIDDIYPQSKTASVNATISVLENGILKLSGAEAGAAFLVLFGNVEPQLLSEKMEMKSAYDGFNNVTRVIIYSLDNRASFSGEFLDIGSGQLLSIEAATYNAEPIALNRIELPIDFVLYQNYPNPFNATTEISFDLPIGGEYRLSIYNVSGQLVETFTGKSEAGKVEVSWNADNWPSGVYLYKLESGRFVESRKMVLVK